MMKKKILLVVFMSLILLISSCGNSSLKNIDIKLDADNRGNTFENLHNFGWVANDDENIYYSILNRLYKFNIESNETTELINGVFAQSLNVLDGWVYYLNFIDSGIYKISVNGTDNQKINEVKATRLYVQDDVLYAKGVFEQFNNNLYIMDIDGDNVRLLSDMPMTFFYVHDEFIYYQEFAPHDRNQRIGRMRLDGSEQEVIVETFGSPNWFAIHDDNLLYVIAGNLYEVNLTDRSEQKILEMGYHLEYTRNIHQNKLFYTTFELRLFGLDFRLRLHSFDLITHETARTTIPRNRQSQPPFSDFIIGDKIFRTHDNGFLMMNLDGSDIRLRKNHKKMPISGQTNGNIIDCFFIRVP